MTSRSLEELVRMIGSLIAGVIYAGLWRGVALNICSDVRGSELTAEVKSTYAASLRRYARYISTMRYHLPNSSIQNLDGIARFQSHLIILLPIFFFFRAYLPKHNLTLAWKLTTARLDDHSASLRYKCGFACGERFVYLTTFPKEILLAKACKRRTQPLH
jgi:hypothetical protein